MKHFPVVISVFVAIYANACQSQTDTDVGQQQDNPLEFSIDNIKRGKQYFILHCITCHGADGRGDTEMREFLKTPPADLSDDQWVYGGSSEAIFSVIKAGRTARDMPAFEEKLNDERIWQIMNYMEYLGGRRP